jgi:hypothetical protein
MIIYQPHTRSDNNRHDSKIAPKNKYLICVCFFPVDLISLIIKLNKAYIIYTKKVFPKLRLTINELFVLKADTIIESEIKNNKKTIIGIAAYLGILFAFNKSVK